jgi:hypothetical protein
MLVKHRAAALLAVAAGALAAAAPASADTVTRYGDSNTVFGVETIRPYPVLDPIPHPFVVSGRGQNLGSGTSGKTVNIAFECSAVAPVSSLTRILECYLQGVNDGRIIPVVDTTGGLPGPTDATGGAAVNAPAEPYRVCVQARADMQTTQGTQTVTSSLICS